MIESGSKLFSRDLKFNIASQMPNSGSGRRRRIPDSASLASVLDRRVLLQLQHDGPHPGHVLRVLRRLGAEVAQLGHP
jgi:hypothetical protein